MFTHEHRLQKETDIQRVLKSKKGVFDAACGIKFAPNGLAQSRFAIVVGTKVSKNAVERNRIRRQYREILRAHLIEILPGFDIMLLTSKPSLALDYAAKHTRLLGVLRKTGLLRSTNAVA